ncbi:MAG TPA: SDR family NAD(P)-dependent oxidoreductase, partial [Stellaceae bacterium]
MRFEGKIALITAVASGIGRATADIMAREGATIVAVDNNAERLEKTVAEITAAGGEAMGVVADIVDPDDVQQAVSEVTAAFGPPLIVIGQTKFNIPGDFADILDHEQYVESFKSYTMSQIYLLHAVLPGMKNAGWGRFVHIGSATAKEPEGAIHHVIANA